MAERTERTTRRETAPASEPLKDYALHDFPNPVIFDLTLLQGSSQGLRMLVDLGPVQENVEYRTLAEVRFGIEVSAGGSAKREAARALLAALKIPASSEQQRLRMVSQLTEMAQVINLTDEPLLTATDLMTAANMSLPSPSGTTGAADEMPVTPTSKPAAPDNRARRARLLQQNHDIATENAELRKGQANKRKLRVLAERIVGF